MGDVRWVSRLKALILAAGKGTRLRPYSETTPKSLMELVPGLTIIEFIIGQLRKVGVTDIVVVTRSELVEKFRNKLGDEVSYVSVDGGKDFGNLYTVEEALRKVEDDHVLLVMSDHIFERELLNKLVNCGDSKPVILCLDRNPKWMVINEGLRVKINGSGVEKVGKDLPPYHGVDTGLFLLSNEAFNLVFETVKKLGCSSKIADLVNAAAENSKVGYVDVTGHLWMDIDTPKDLLKARKLYWKIKGKDLVKPSDGPVSKRLNRPISTKISLFLYQRNRVTSNQVSFLAFLLGLASASLFLLNNLVLGGILTYISSVFDGVDGELARLRSEESFFGGVLDSLLDRFVDLSLILSIGINYFRNPYLSPSWVVFLVSLASFGVILVSYVSKLFGSKAAKLRSGFPWATRDVRLFTFTIGGLTMFPLIPLVFCAFAPLIFSGKALLTLSRKSSPVKVKKGKVETLRPPQPQIKVVENKAPKESRRHLTDLFSNIVKLTVSLAVIRILLYSFGGVPMINISLLEIKASHVLNLINLVVIVYFGYGILTSLKFFLDIASDIVVSKLEVTKTAYSRATLDILYLIGLALIWFAVSPLLENVPEIGEWLRMPLGLLILAVFTLILYDLSRIFYRSLKGALNKVIDAVTEAIEKCTK